MARHRCVHFRPEVTRVGRTLTCASLPCREGRAEGHDPEPHPLRGGSCRRVWRGQRYVPGPTRRAFEARKLTSRLSPRHASQLRLVHLPRRPETPRRCVTRKHDPDSLPEQCTDSEPDLLAYRRHPDLHLDKQRPSHGRNRGRRAAKVLCQGRQEGRRNPLAVLICIDRSDAYCQSDSALGLRALEKTSSCILDETITDREKDPVPLRLITRSGGPGSGQ